MARAKSKTIRWQHDGRDTDGHALVAEDFVGWSLEVNGEEVMSVPRGWETDGQYEVPTADVGAFEEAGDYSIRLRLIFEGASSDFSAPMAFILEASKPTAPFGLSVA